MWTPSGKNQQHGEESGITWYRDRLGYYSYEPRGYSLIRYRGDHNMTRCWELRCVRGGERSLGLFRWIWLAFAVAEADLIRSEGSLWSGQ